MKHLNKIISYFFLFSILSAPAYAYLDPGTGSMLLQGLIAGFAAVIVAIKKYWYAINSFYKKIFNKSK